MSQKVASFDVVVGNQDRRSGDFNLFFVCSLFILWWVMIVSPWNNTKQSIIPSLVPPPPPRATYSPLHRHTSPEHRPTHTIVTYQITHKVLVNMTSLLGEWRFTVFKARTNKIMLRPQRGCGLGSSRSMGPQTIRSRSQLQIKHLVTRHQFLGLLNERD